VAVISWLLMFKILVIQRAIKRLFEQFDAMPALPQNEGAAR
jgi:hypothetical protein